MKKFTLLFAIVCLIGFMSMKPGADEKSLANVRKVQGKYMFTDCEPVSSYEAVGTVKIGMVWDNSSINDVPEIQSQALKRAERLAKKERLEFDGLIINATDDITLIKWKD